MRHYSFFYFLSCSNSFSVPIDSICNLFSHVRVIAICSFFVWATMTHSLFSLSQVPSFIGSFPSFPGSRLLVLLPVTTFWSSLHSLRTDSLPPQFYFWTLTCFLYILPCFKILLDPDGILSPMVHLSSYCPGRRGFCLLYFLVSLF